MNFNSPYSRSTPLLYITTIKGVVYESIHYMNLYYLYKQGTNYDLKIEYNLIDIKDNNTENYAYALY